MPWRMVVMYISLYQYASHCIFSNIVLSIRHFRHCMRHALVLGFSSFSKIVTMMWYRTSVFSFTVLARHSAALCDSLC